MNYDSTKITDLSNALVVFDASYIEYNNILNSFHENLNTLLNAQHNLDTSTEQVVEDSANGQKYLCTKEGYVFPIDATYNTPTIDITVTGIFTSAQKYDTVTIGSNNYVFIDDISAADISYSGSNQYHTNKIFQIGLGNFETHKILSHDLYSLSDVTSDLSFVTKNGTCDKDSYNQCANYARTNFGNTGDIATDLYRNFGLSLVDNSCTCFVTEDGQI